MDSEISLNKMLEAQQKTKNHLNLTPIMTSSTINQIVGADVYFKCEHLQKTGSFKARGALYSALMAKEKKTEGVIAHSSGNHGQALAWAAKQIGLKCAVVVPENAAPSKVQAIKEYGATIIVCAPTVAAREETCRKYAKQFNYSIVDPSNCETMINGHASVVYEILDQIGDKIDSVFVSIGGGGLAASIAFCLGELRPDISVFLVEPQQKQLSKLLKNNIRCPVDTLTTIADGVRVAHIGSLCKPILQKYCTKNVISVSDDEIRQALILIWTRMKQRVEPTAALAFAAVAFHLPENVKNPLVILCGGNVDANFQP